MVLARPVLAPSGRTLLQAGLALTDLHLHKLRQLEVPMVTVLADDPPDSQVVRWLASLSNRVPYVIDQQLRGQAMGFIDGVLRQARLRGDVDVGASRQVVDKLLEELLAKETAVSTLVDYNQADTYLSAHSVSVSVIALHLGLKKGSSRIELRELGLAGLLHDIGKARVPADLLSKPGPLTDEEWVLMRRHPELGSQMLGCRPGVGEQLTAALVQHHERYDGLGYPHGLAGDQIHPMAELIALADVFDALSSERFYRAKCEPYEVAETMIALSGEAFRPSLLRFFLANVPAYPPGTVVRFNTGEVAMVKLARPEMPTRPLCEMVFDADGVRLDRPRLVDLAEQLAIFPAQVLGAEPIGPIAGHRG